MGKNLKFDFNNIFKSNIGEYGFEDKKIEKSDDQIKNAHEAMMDNKQQMAWRALPFNQDEIVDDIIKTAVDINKNFESFVVLGIGGSALGPVAVFAAMKHLRYNELSGEKRGGVKYYVEDNIDPERMSALLDVIDIKKTMFNVITKSGKTSETMAQLKIVFKLLKDELGDGYKNNIIATTDKENGNLIKIAKEHGLKTYYIPQGVGGRFSELCPVGLLSAAVLNIDIKDMLKGAAKMESLCSQQDIYKNPAYMYALIHVLAMKRGMNISVMLPYADSLKYMSDWYGQIWAESLGKKFDKNGKKVRVGQTPVKAVGVTDQHSQIQLYVEGPHDKIITFLKVENFRQQVTIPKAFNNIKDIRFLDEKTLNELLAAELKATEYALVQAGTPNLTITMPQVDANTVGQLLYFFEMATAFAGELLGINTFDQPGVEEGKIAAFALMGKKGFEEKAAELNARPPKNSKYMF